MCVYDMLLAMRMHFSFSIYIFFSSYVSLFSVRCFYYGVSGLIGFGEVSVIIVARSALVCLYDRFRGVELGGGKGYKDPRHESIEGRKRSAFGAEVGRQKKKGQPGRICTRFV